MKQNEDDRQAGALRRDPRSRFTRLAAKHGLIRDGDKLDQSMIDFANDIVSECADIGDQYGNAQASAGAHIRAALLDGAEG